MASAQTTIAIIVFSLSIGFLSFYLISNLPKKAKKVYMEELASQLVNFFIFIWISKILLNFTIFIKDPLAILAYPSDSSAFYLAVFFTVITVTIKINKHKIDPLTFLTAFTYFFLSASFVYEFTQIVWNNNTYSIKYIGLLAVLIIALITMRDRITDNRLSIIILIGWTIGTLGLIFIMTLTMVFGYTISRWFLILVLIFLLLLIIIKKRKKEGIIIGRN